MCKYCKSIITKPTRALRKSNIARIHVPTIVNRCSDRSNLMCEGSSLFPAHFSAVRESDNFFGVCYRRLSWCTWYRARLRVTCSPAFSMLLARCLKRCRMHRRSCSLRGDIMLLLRCCATRPVLPHPCCRHRRNRTPAIFSFQHSPGSRVPLRRLPFSKRCCNPWNVRPSHLRHRDCQPWDVRQFLKPSCEVRICWVNIRSPGVLSLHTTHVHVRLNFLTMLTVHGSSPNPLVKATLPFFALSTSVNILSFSVSDEGFLFLDVIIALGKECSNSVECASSVCGW